MALPQLVWDLVTSGTVAVIAHPERNAEVQERPDRLEGVVDMGAVIQLTAASVDGRLGKRTSGCSRALLELGLAHLIASDAHAPGVRLAGMSAAAAAVGGGELARVADEHRAGRATRRRGPAASASGGASSRPARAPARVIRPRRAETRNLRGQRPSPNRPIRPMMSPRGE